MDDRIKLAEWSADIKIVPFKDVQLCLDGTQATMRIVYPNGCGQICNEDNILEHIPDPANNAEDCEQLIRFVGSRGWEYEERRQSTVDFGDAAGIWIEFWNPETEVHHRWDGSLDLRGKGVVALAVKIMESDDEQT